MEKTLKKGDGECLLTFMLWGPGAVNRNQWQREERLPAHPMCFIAYICLQIVCCLEQPHSSWILQVGHTDNTSLWFSLVLPLHAESNPLLVLKPKMNVLNLSPSIVLRLIKITAGITKNKECSFRVLSSSFPQLHSKLLGGGLMTNNIGLHSTFEQDIKRQ